MANSRILQALAALILLVEAAYAVPADVHSRRQAVGAPAVAGPIADPMVAAAALGGPSHTPPPVPTPTSSSAPSSSGLRPSGTPSVPTPSGVHPRPTGRPSHTPRPRPTFVAAVNNGPSGPNKIVGGVPVDVSEAPTYQWMVSVGVNGAHRCGGQLISPVCEYFP